MNKYVVYGLLGGIALCLILFVVGEAFGTDVMSFKGNWDFAMVYTVQDVVKYKNYFYLSLRGSQGVYPDLSADDWLCLTCSVGGKK